MQWEMMSHFNENTKKSKPRCYFLSSVVLCIFLVCVVWMKEKKIVAIILRHRQPLHSLNHHRVWCRWIFAASFLFFLFCFFYFNAQWWCLHAISLHIHPQISAAWRRMLYLPLQWIRKSDACTKCWNNERKLKWCCWLCISLLCDAAFFLFLFFLLFRWLLLSDHLCHIKLMELKSGHVVIGAKGIWSKVLFGVRDPKPIHQRFYI